MLNKRTTNFITNRLSNSLIKFNISKNAVNYNNNFLINLENENTESKNLFNKRSIDMCTRNAIGLINESKYTLKKSDLINLYLIGQFDKKFCVFYRETDKSIIFFDQHAVHERILYEYYQELLLNEFFNGSDTMNKTQYNLSLNMNVNKNKTNDIKLNLFIDIYGKYLLKNNKFTVKANKFNINMELFRKSVLYNNNCNIQTFLNFTWAYSPRNDMITFYTVPIIFDKIHKIEVLIDIFSNIINNIENYWNWFINKKRNILEPFDSVIKSKACRNAVKFNDELENKFMKNMIYELSFCKNPFLCAHGRHNYFIKYKKSQ